MWSHAGVLGLLHLLGPPCNIHLRRRIDWANGLRCDHRDLAWARRPPTVKWIGKGVQGKRCLPARRAPKQGHDPLTAGFPQGMTGKGRARRTAQLSPGRESPVRKSRRPPFPDPVGPRNLLWGSGARLKWRGHDLCWEGQETITSRHNLLVGGSPLQVRKPKGSPRVRCRCPAAPATPLAITLT